MRGWLPTALLLGFSSLLMTACGGDEYEGDQYQGVAFHAFTTDPNNITCAPSTMLVDNRDCDPVNLIWPGKSVVEVEADLIASGWSHGLGSTQWLYFYDDTSGTWEGKTQNTQLILRENFLERYHIRLWEAPGPITLAGVHHETGFISHTIDMNWDEAEAFVSEQLCSFACQPSVSLTRQDEIQGEDGEWRTWLNDALATEIISGITYWPAEHFRAPSRLSSFALCRANRSSWA